MNTRLTALSINCTLKQSPAESSTRVLEDQLSTFLEERNVDVGSVRAVDHAISPGVSTYMGEGDEWPSLRKRILEADILILLTPTWLGQHSSVAQRVLERLDAELSEKDANGLPTLFNKVAVAGVLGNEDGAHHIVGIFYQALSDVGFTIPAQGCVYWNGEAMQTTDYKDLEHTPEKVTLSMTTALTNAIHLAQLLRADSYPRPTG